MAVTCLPSLFKIIVKPIAALISSTFGSRLSATKILLDDLIFSAIFLGTLPSCSAIDWTPPSVLTGELVAPRVVLSLLSVGMFILTFYT